MSMTYGASELATKSGKYICITCQTLASKYFEAQMPIDLTEL